jgi:hypothetical protein
MKNLSFLLLFITQFIYSQNSNQSVRDFVEEKYFTNQETGRSIKFGYISSLNTYGLTFKDSGGNLAYFMNCSVNISSNNQYMALTYCMSPITGDTMGKIGVYKDKMILYGTDGSLVFYIDNSNIDSVNNSDYQNKISEPILKPIGPKSIIGKKIIIGKLQVAQYDFPQKMSYNEAVKECEKLGKGWRIPTNAEWRVIYKNKLKIGGFPKDAWYWTSSKLSSEEIKNADPTGQYTSYLEDVLFILKFESLKFITEESKFKYKIRAVRSL